MDAATTTALVVGIAGVTMALGSAKPMDATTVTAWLFGIAGIITAIGSFVLALRKDLATTKELTVVADKKLDNLTTLANGQRGEMLKELADVKDMFAQETGRRADQDAATAALVRYLKQQELAVPVHEVQADLKAKADEILKKDGDK